MSNSQNLATNCSRIRKMSRYGKRCSKISLKNVLFPQKIKETSNKIFPIFFGFFARTWKFATKENIWDSQLKNKQQNISNFFCFFARTWKFTTIENIWDSQLKKFLQCNIEFNLLGAWIIFQMSAVVINHKKI